ncbi:hypothetical protein GUJ93_ZPchr0004g39026 [Zizania palustris]|uniref:Uncharacterized protein n=1 Tax=Zizania palustris TaxID=103762 RepID=A0A8J5SZJ0_ZIZPA|nr:hypothetical protein GUJ93_ZPchr0004g39026 [Zizania palustris]
MAPRSKFSPPNSILPQQFIKRKTNPQKEATTPAAQGYPVMTSTILHWQCPSCNLRMQFPTLQRLPQ